MSDSEFEDSDDIDDISRFIINEFNRQGIENRIKGEQVFSNYDNV